ncbi:MAG: acyl-CoA thioesterase II [Sphingomonadaceae bacterium]|nr:acyl-CoA thioesterase II [Sphingomonadaceae bacterium]
MTNDPATLVSQLVELMNLEAIEVDLFRGPVTSEPWVRVFGGQVVGQALIAACRTVELPRLPHSLHAYFMRPGDPHQPIVYQVNRDRDGGSFSSRRVVAIQNGKPILNLAASFQVPEQGLEHHFAMPDVPPPEGLEDDRVIVERHKHLLSARRLPTVLRERPIAFRPTDPIARFGDEKLPPHRSYWFRAVAPLPDDQVLHRGLLAYASDMMLLGTAMRPHGLNWMSDMVQEASLDHAVWIHEDVTLDDWLLYVLDSPWSGQARGFNRGLIYTRAGRLVASVAQEGLIRVRPPKS